MSGRPILGDDGPVVLVDARTAYLLRDGLRRWANDHRSHGGGAKVLAVLPVLQAMEVAADYWAGQVLAVPKRPASADGRADAVVEPESAGWKQHLTSDQVADLLGLTARQVRRLAATEELPGHRLGGVWTFDPDDINAARQQRQQRKPA